MPARRSVGVTNVALAVGFAPMLEQAELVLIPRGPFSLRAAAEFGFGPNEGRLSAFDGAMRLAFPLDGGRGYVGAVLRQEQTSAPVTVELHCIEVADQQAALRQLARILSLDQDGEEFVHVGERDHVIGALQRAHPGQRPVLFHSPYEAAAWSIISARRPAAQSTRVRAALSKQLGATFELAGQTLHAFPQPGRLLESGDQLPGLNPEKVGRLHGVADASLAGRLDVELLHELGPERAWAEIQRLRGIGPFYAGLVVLRASGFADALLPLAEAKGLSHLTRFYDLASEPSPERRGEIAEGWRPFRTWAAVLIRLAGDRGTALADR